MEQQTLERQRKEPPLLDIGDRVPRGPLKYSTLIGKSGLQIPTLGYVLSPLNDTARQPLPQAPEFRLVGNALQTPPPS